MEKVFKAKMLDVIRTFELETGLHVESLDYSLGYAGQQLLRVFLRSELDLPLGQQQMEERKEH